MFTLEIGLPGNSFAFELARKMRLPENIVKDAENRAGEEFVGIERNLRTIARNRRKLDEKLQKIKHTDKALDALTDKYQKELEDIKSKRKAILEEAKAQAEDIVKGAGAQVEKTIRDIKEAQAAKEETKAAPKAKKTAKKAITGDEDTSVIIDTIDEILKGDTYLGDISVEDDIRKDVAASKKDYSFTDIQEIAKNPYAVLKRFYTRLLRLFK